MHIYVRNWLASDTVQINLFFGGAKPCFFMELLGHNKTWEEMDYEDVQIAVWYEEYQEQMRPGK